MSMDDRVWREGDPKWTWLLGESVPRYMFSQIPHNFIVDKLNELEAAEQIIEKAMQYAFEAGYGSGHNDTVEGMFSLDEETMAEEWLADIKSDGTFKAIIGASHD